MLREDVSQVALFNLQKHTHTFLTVLSPPKERTVVSETNHLNSQEMCGCSSHPVVNSTNENPIGDNCAQAVGVVGRAVVFWRRDLRGGGAAVGLRWTGGWELD